MTPPFYIIENLNHFSNKPQNPLFAGKNQQNIHQCKDMPEPEWLKTITNPEKEDFQHFPLFEDGYRNDFYYDDADFAALQEEEDFIRERELEYRKLRRSKLRSDYFFFREQYFNKFKPNTEEAQSIRSNIKVLIIVGTLYAQWANYVSNYQDFASALTLRHLYHFYYGIPYDSILIASLESQDFDTNKFKNPPLNQNEFLSPNYPFPPQFLKGPFVDISGKIYLQVGLDQICFQLDKDPSEIIQPLNNVIIEKLCEGNGKPSLKPDLILYFIDHGNPGYFSSKQFDNYFFTKINMNLFEHKYIICDFCFSGSIIHLIKLSQALLKLGIIFSPNNHLNKKMFYILTIIPFHQSFGSYKEQLNLIKQKAKVNPYSDKLTRISNDAKVNVHQWLDIPQIINSEFQILDKPEITFVQEFIQGIPSSLYNLQISLYFCYENNIQIDPSVYYSTLSENTTFICSSFTTDKSYPLPIRRVEIDKLPFILRCFGNLSTSLYLNALIFDSVSKITNDSIIESINKSMEQYKSSIFDIISQQIATPYKLNSDSSQENSEDLQIPDIQVDKNLPEDIKSLIYYLIEDLSKEHDISYIFNHHYLKDDNCFLFNNEEWPNFKLLLNGKADQCFKRSKIPLHEFEGLVQNLYLQGTSPTSPEMPILNYDAPPTYTSNISDSADINRFSLLLPLSFTYIFEHMLNQNLKAKIPSQKFFYDSSKVLLTFPREKDAVEVYRQFRRNVQQYITYHHFPYMWDIKNSLVHFIYSNMEIKDIIVECAVDAFKAASKFLYR